MDIQYREYSMQNEYTFGCILFKKFIYLQSYICNRYNCLHFVHQFIHRFLSITLLSFTFVSRRILHIAADPLPLLISNPCAHIPLSFSFGLLTVLHHLIVGQSNAEACSRLQMRVMYTIIP